MMRFGSLEFMSLGIEYDMVLLPWLTPRNVQASVLVLLVVGGGDRATVTAPPVAPHVLARLPN
jgi:hypothetical protein